MEKMNSVNAVKIIEAAIAGGTFKLTGPSTTKDEAVSSENAKIDAAYILKLYSLLTGGAKDEA
jgi:hypothetical protein